MPRPAPSTAMPAPIDAPASQRPRAPATERAVSWAGGPTGVDVVACASVSDGHTSTTASAASRWMIFFIPILRLGRDEAGDPRCPGQAPGADTWDSTAASLAARPPVDRETTTP